MWTLTPALSEPVTSIAVTSYPSSTVKHSALLLTLLGAGGGGIRPPYHNLVIPRKKSMGKVANFFLLFLDMTQCQDEVRTYSAGTHILKVVKWG